MSSHSEIFAPLLQFIRSHSGEWAKFALLFAQGHDMLFMVKWFLRLEKCYSTMKSVFRQTLITTIKYKALLLQHRYPGDDKLVQELENLRINCHKFSFKKLAGVFERLRKLENNSH